MSASKILVAGSGDVAAYCKAQGMEVAEEYTGDVLNYAGSRNILVIAQDMPIFEFYYAQYRLLKQGVMLISTHDYGGIGKVLQEFVKYLISRENERRRTERRGGRQPFGFRWQEGHREIVECEYQIAKEIVTMREEQHKSFRDIEKSVWEAGYRTQKGRKITVSTIQVILKNRDLYR